MYVNDLYKGIYKSKINIEDYVWICKRKIGLGWGVGGYEFI